jgi:putative SOS response-associated peptidase YedK
MCYHVTLLPGNFHNLTELFDKPAVDAVKAGKRYTPGFHLSGFDHPYLPVILPQGMDMYRWGLIPHWVKAGETYRANTLNARNDELFDKVSYKQYWQNRCLVVVSGFFEPHTPISVASKKQKTESWFIKSADEALLTLGGIYNGETLSIITTDASPLLARVHNDGKRMPLIFSEEQDRERWLDPGLLPGDMEALMESRPGDERLTAYRTIDGVMNAKIPTNVPEVIQPFSGPNFGVLPLFES